MAPDEIQVRINILNALGISLPDPHIYNVCALDGDTFDALCNAIYHVQMDAFNRGWDSAKEIALEYEQARRKARIIT
jgi:phage tail protein X